MEGDPKGAFACRLASVGDSAARKSVIFVHNVHFDWAFSRDFAKFCTVRAAQDSGPLTWQPVGCAKIDIGLS